MGAPPFSLVTPRGSESQLSKRHPLHQMFAIEIFAGSGRLTASLRAVGLQDSFGVDLKLPSTLRSPIIKYDLTQDDHLAIVVSLIQSEFCCFVHFAPSCGTSSRARLIPRKGRWNPPIVRTDSHPDGLPGLQGTLALRVQAANKLYSITCDLLEICLKGNKYFAVENILCGSLTPFRH